MSDVLSAMSDGVLEVTINRPERLNALHRAARETLLAALNGAASDAGVRAVVLTGAGRAFCTGQDLAAADELVDAGATVRDSYNPLVRAIRRSPKPVIAAINGPAVGAGLGLALACDLRLMADVAYLACSFGLVGLVPDTGVTAALVRLLGHARAFELAVTGRRVPASEAQQLGMVNQVVAADELLDEARELAKRLAAAPATAISLTKQLFAAAGEETEAHLLEREAESQGIAAASPEHQEALAAFLSRSRAR